MEGQAPESTDTRIFMLPANRRRLLLERNRAVIGRRRAVRGRRHILRGTRERGRVGLRGRSEEHTSELQSLMRISYAVFCLKKKKRTDKVQSINSHYTRLTDQPTKTEQLNKVYEQ